MRFDPEGSLQDSDGEQSGQLQPASPLRPGTGADSRGDRGGDEQLDMEGRGLQQSDGLGWTRRGFTFEEKSCLISVPPIEPETIQAAIL